MAVGLVTVVQPLPLPQSQVPLLLPLLPQFEGQRPLPAVAAKSTVFDPALSDLLFSVWAFQPVTAVVREYLGLLGVRPLMEYRPLEPVAADTPVLTPFVAVTTTPDSGRP